MKISINAKWKNFQREMIRLCSQEPPLGYYNETVVVASRQIGKSFALRALCLLYASKPNAQICYTTTSQRLASKFLREFKRILSGIKGIEFNQSDLRITFPNNSEISFFSAESADRLRGNSFTEVIVDEAAFIRDIDSTGSSFFNDVLLPTLDAIGKQLVLVSTPHGQGNFFFDHYQKAKAANRLIEVPVTADETKSQEWLDAKKESIPLNTWLQEYLCQFLSAGFSFFDAESYADSFNRVAAYGANVGCYVGIDPAVGGGDACGVVLLFPFGENIYVDAYAINTPKQDKEVIAAKVAEVLKPYYQKIQGLLVEDVSPKGFWQDLKRYLPPVVSQRITTFVTTNQSKYSICTSLNSALPYMRFRMEDANTMKVQLDSFVVLKQVGTTTVLGNSNPKIHDDLVLGLALAYECYSRGKKKGSYGIKFG